MKRDWHFMKRYWIRKLGKSKFLTNKLKLRRKNGGNENIFRIKGNGLNAMAEFLIYISESCFEF